MGIFLSYFETPVPKPREFKVVATTQAEEDAYDYVTHRTNTKPTGVVGSIAHMVKGALGAGIMSSHVAYMKTGVYVAVPLTFILGIYMAYCLKLLVQSAQILYRRTHIPSMSYPDVGEAAMACFPKRCVSKCSKCFRYLIDIIISLDLFGSCACYQLIIATSIKQLVENTQITNVEGLTKDYPGIRVYLAAMIIPVICICLIRHLKYLAPFSLAANFVILFCIGMTFYYAISRNPTFSSMKTHDTLSSVFEFVGMLVFGMSCAGVVLPVENNMREPKKFNLAFAIGMACIASAIFLVAFFGYAGFLDKCESPITVNFPMETLPKVLKGLIAFMIYITHALNFWVPFNLVFYYLQKCHSEKHVVTWELIYRAMIVVVISFVAIIFPNVNALMGFIGTFCLTNMAIIWPCTINLLVIWHRPGLGKLKWRLWKNIFLIIIGICVFFCGSYVNGAELLSTVKF